MSKVISNYGDTNCPSMAVFCDFDGTLSVQDVGASIARLYAAENRSRLRPEFERGNLLPWEYNVLLFEGLYLPEKELDQHLRNIDLDPGGPALMSWCRARRIPFCVVSDGFDYNLERLKEFNNIDFEYRANRLWFENGHWRIAPGYPDPSCECGTGVCKRLLIESFRKLNMSTKIVHIGNGRVSDTCGAVAADYVFAKESLAEELRARDVEFQSFATLFDVISGLDHS